MIYALFCSNFYIRCLHVILLRECGYYYLCVTFALLSVDLCQMVYLFVNLSGFCLYVNYLYIFTYSLCKSLPLRPNLYDLTLPV